MSRIVKFPGQKQSPRRSRMAVVAEPVDRKGHVHNSQLSFTCVHCGGVNQMQFDNVIFRSVDLFCGKCGSGWKLTNPMFSSKKSQAGGS